MHCMKNGIKIALISGILFSSLFIFLGCVSSPAQEKTETAKTGTETATTAVATKATGPRTEKISFKKALDDWNKGTVSSADGTVTIAPQVDMRHFSINVKIPVTPDLAYIELEVKSDNFDAAWGGKACGFKLNDKVLDPIGLTLVTDPDGWHWAVMDMFEDGLLYVQLPVDSLQGSTIEVISIYVGGNAAGTLTFSGFNAVYK